MSLEDMPREGADRSVGSMVVIGLALLVAAGGLAFTLLRGAATPPPAEIASDPLLSAGREVYLSRCVSCHGETGKGDGPIAKGLQGPPVGDLTDREWKHGERTEDIREVVERGVRDTAMSGWKGMISERNLTAVVAYVEYLAGRRQPVAAPSREEEPR